MDCIFCKIAAGEIPCGKIYEDELMLAFRDIQPQAPVHLLVIPKAHIAGVDELNTQNSGVIAHIFAHLPRLAREQELGNGYRVVVNSGADGQQTVPHLHFHLLGGRLLAWPPG